MKKTGKKFSLFHLFSFFFSFILSFLLFSCASSINFDEVLDQDAFLKEKLRGAQAKNFVAIELNETQSFEKKPEEVKKKEEEKQKVEKVEKVEEKKRKENAKVVLETKDVKSEEVKKSKLENKMQIQKVGKIQTKVSLQNQEDDIQVAELENIENKENKKQRITTSSQRLKRLLAYAKKAYPQDYPAYLKNLDKDSLALWQKAKLNLVSGETHHFDVSFIGIPVGDFKLTVGDLVTLNSHTALPLRLNLKSSNYYSFIYALKDSVESFLDIETLTPIKYSLVQRETKQNVDELMLFDQKTLKYQYWYSRIPLKKKRDARKREGVANTPKFFHDYMTLFFFLRSLDLKVGEILEIPVAIRGMTDMAQVTIEEEEEDFDFNDKILKSVRMSCRFYDIDEEGKKVEDKRNSFLVWISQDELKMILKFKAKLRFGSVSGDLIKHEI